MTDTATSRIAALSSSGPGRSVARLTFGRESTSAMLALTCGTAWMPGATPWNSRRRSPNAVVATSSPVFRGFGSRVTLAW